MRREGCKDGCSGLLSLQVLVPRASQQRGEYEGSLVREAAEIPLETEHAATAEWPEGLKACIEAWSGHFE